MRAFALVLLLAACAPHAVQAKIYKWVMPDGTTEYSDRPQQGGTAVELPPLQIYSAPPTPAPDQGASSGARDAADAADGYDVVKVTSPTSDEVIRDDGVGTVNVQVQLKPGLRSGHTLDIFLDGRSIGSGRLTRVELTNVDRGTHTVSAVVKNATGEVVAQADGVTFHLKKVSVLLPAKPAQGPPPRPTPPIARPPRPSQ